MDANQQQNTTPTTHQAPPKAKTTSMITPAHKCPRQLTFRIRRREFTFEGNPSLLITDRHGVWSVTHRRYIRKTRHHRFHAMSNDPLLAYYMTCARRWPEFARDAAADDDEEIGSLRRRLSALYWSLMQETKRARIVRFCRDERRRVATRRRVCFVAAVVVVAIVGFVLLRVVLMGESGALESLLLGAGYVVMAYWLLCDMWRGIYAMNPPRL